jgi:hypothetical protein
MSANLVLSRFENVSMNSIATLGQAETRCTNSKYKSNSFMIDCKYGVISQIESFGVFQMSSEADNENVCHSRVLDQIDTGLEPGCLGLSDPENYLRKELSAQCLGKKTCFID